MGSDEHLTELNEAARRAGDMLTEEIDSIIGSAERQAETIRREAERDAEDMQREAVDAAKRLLDRLQALEFPLGELVVSLRDEVEQVSRELGRGEHVDSHAISLPPVSESAHAGPAEEEVASEREGESVPEEGSATDADLPTEEPPNQPTEPEPGTTVASEREPVTAAGDEGPAPGEDGGKVRRRSPRHQRSQK